MLYLNKCTPPMFIEINALDFSNKFCQSLEKSKGCKIFLIE